jgi:hypothetical protein
MARPRRNKHCEYLDDVQGNQNSSCCVLLDVDEKLRSYCVCIFQGESINLQRPWQLRSFKKRKGFIFICLKQPKSATAYEIMEDKTL